MATHVIAINGIDGDGRLVLSDRGHTPAELGYTVLWQIHPKSGVHSITSIVEKTGSDNIWEKPPQPQGKTWTGTIVSDTESPREYIYSIHWKASENGQTKIHDPVISIKPTPFIPPELIKLLLAGIFGFLTFQFLLKKKK